MSDRTKIAWTDATWNPIRGCSRVSEGCRFCYAEAVAARFSGPGQPYYGLAKRTSSGPIWTGKLALVEKHLDDPIRWTKPRRIFVNSMSDLFHENVPDEWTERIFVVMALAQRHTFQVLTKRPKRMLAWLTSRAGLETREECVARAAESAGQRLWGKPGAPFAFDSRGSEQHKYFPAAPSKEQLAVRRPWPGWPLPNVWLGVSVEDQHSADERIPLLLQTPAAVRWVSAEPLLGPVSLDHYLTTGCPTCWMDDTPGIDWVIVGGESGPRARPCNVEWIRSIVRQCREAGVPCFVKQDSGSRPGNQGRISDEDWAVKEYPDAVR